MTYKHTMVVITLQRLKRGDILALAIGLVAFLVLFGPSFMLGQSIYLAQPEGDNAVEMSAYFRMAQDSWRFPLFSLPMANEPEGSNQLFSGGVPILALVAKVIHSLTGQTVNLLGFWFMLCCVLQAHSVYFLITQITGRSPYLAALASLSGLLAYAFLTRFGHVSLFGQFVVIYAMGFVIATTLPDANAKRILGWLAGLSALGMFVFAYFGFTNAFLFGAAVVSLWWLNRIRLRGAALALASFVAMMLGLAWIGGFFWGVGRADPIAAASFGVLGLNLGSLVIPHESALFPSHLVLRNWWEGDFYLGAGIIAAWVMILLFMPQAVIKPIIRHWPLAVALSAFTLFCLSNQIKFGATTLVSYELPAFMNPLVGMLRAGGRLFWPVGYLLIAAPLALVIHHFPRYATCIVVALGIVAILEATGTYRFLQAVTKAERKPPIDYADLKSIISNHTAVRIYPSFWCDGSSKHTFHREVEFLLGLKNVRSNSVITARKIKDCEREAASMLVLQPGELNIFTSLSVARSAVAGTAQDPSQVCRTFRLDRGIAAMCSANWTQTVSLPISELQTTGSLVADLAINETINFGQLGNKDRFLGEGWYDGDEAFAWSKGARSTVVFKLASEPPAGTYFEVTLYPYLRPPYLGMRTVVVSVNGKKLPPWNLTIADWQFHRIPAPASREITIAFEQSEFRSPDSFGDSGDPRNLGIAVKSIVLRGD